MKNKVCFLISVIFIILSCTHLNNPFLPSLLVEHNNQIIDRQTPETRGKEFYLAFSQQYAEEPENPLSLSLFITGYKTTSGNILVNGLNSNINFSLSAGEIKEIPIPAETAISSNDTVENFGIYIQTDNLVSVTCLNQKLYTTDSSLIFPVQSLGTEYYAMAYKSATYITDPLNYTGTPISGSVFIIVAAQDDTTVNITPTITSGSRTAGVEYSIKLNKFQSYRLIDNDLNLGDATGSRIISDKPVAVFSGHKLTFVPAGIMAGDHLYEQMIPVKYWSTSYFAVPFAGRSRYTLRILASHNNTAVNINGSIISTINAGEFFEQIMTNAAIITADNPVLSAQFAHGTEDESSDTTKGDPFMILLPGEGQFLNNYRFSTPETTILNNYINLIILRNDLNKIKLDNSSIDPLLFFDINEKYMGAKVPVSAGTHSVTGTNKFGLIIYGFYIYESYGHTGG